MTYATMSLAQLTEVYNKLTDKPIKKFSCSREAAIAKINTLEALATPVITPIVDEPAKTKKQSIGSFVLALNANGTSRASIVEAVMTQFPNAAFANDAKKAAAHVSWYISKAGK